MKNPHRFGPRDHALLVRGLPKNGPGPCERCSEYTDSEYGSHPACLLAERMAWHRKTRRALEARVATIIAKVRAKARLLEAQLSLLDKETDHG